MTRLSCPICQDETKLFTKAADFEIYRCPKCGFGLTKNLKPQQEDYHRDEIYIEEEALFKNIFLKRVNLILRFKKSGKALEVGSSTGIMLKLLKDRGWEVRGIELSKKAAQIAQEAAVKVLIGDFLKIKLKQKFDLVIFNHTLEHLDNPRMVIKKSVSLLNKNGLLYIDLPNFASLSAQVLKSAWPSLLPAEHLWHFTLDSLGRLLQEHKMEIIYIERASGIWDYQQPIVGVINSLLKFKKRFFRESLTAPGAWLATKLNIGSDLMVICRKR